MTITDILRKITALIVALLILQIVYTQCERQFYKQHPELILK